MTTRRTSTQAEEVRPQPADFGAAPTAHWGEQS
jgi:hypothetical protein